ncbi:hypothetical protein Tco_1314135 [Tanacetum coccineum]
MKETMARKCRACDGFVERLLGKPYQSQQYSNNQPSTPLLITYPSNDYQSSIPQLEYAPTVNQQPQQPEFPQLDSGLTVPVFKQGDDPIDAINHMMSFLSAVVTSRYPTTNNQLRNSRTYTPGASGSNSGKQRTVIYKVLLVQAQAKGQILHEEETSILEQNPGTSRSSDVLVEVHNPDNIDNNMINQDVQARPEKKYWAVTPKKQDKRVRFTEAVTSSGTTNTKTASSSNKPMLSSTGVKPSTSASGSQPSGNTKKDKIQQTPSSTQKNKVEAHSRTVKSSLKNKNYVVEPNRTANVQHSKLNANFELLCVKCNGCMLSDNHDLCVLDFINDVNARAKSKSVKKSSKRKVWKPTGKVFTNIGYTWRPTGQTFTIVGNVCPLTRITTTAEVPLRKPTALKSDIP